MPLALVRSEGDAEVADQDFPMPAEWLALKERHPADWDATAGALIHKIEAKRQARRERQGHVVEVQDESTQGTAEILYFHTDHLGTPRELTDASGHIVWSATYKAWGNTAKIEHPGRFVHQVVGNTQVERWQEQSDPVEQNLRFQGQYFDLETGLHYNRFRYYDPDIGRFVSQDPIGLAGGINNYQYAPNPVGWIDPLGLTGARGTWKGPNVPGGVQTGLSTGEGGTGITNPAVQDAYDNVPEELRSDPRMHGNCAEADALSKGANQAGVTDLDELKEIAKNSTFEAQRNDKKGKPMVACRSCAEVQKQLGITDIVGCSKK